MVSVMQLVALDMTSGTAASPQDVKNDMAQRGAPGMRVHTGSIRWSKSTSLAP
jgi:hypothetical protein